MFKIIGTLESEILNELLNIAKQAELKEDISTYAKGRQRCWLNVHWDLKSKTFDRNDCFINKRLWEIVQDIWPEVAIGLLTFSGKVNPVGINLHRDDSYADYESIGIQLSGTCEFKYMGGYRNFCWSENKDPEIEQTYHLKPGDIFQFNCKNKHAAIPSENRYAINLWKISPKFKQEYQEATRLRINPLF